MTAPIDHGPAQARRAHEFRELEQLQARTGGRFRLEIVPDGPLRLHVTCRSPIRQAGGDVVIESVEHEIDLVLPSHWPAEPPILLHRRPPGVFHPNIAPDIGTMAQGLQGIMRAPAGYVCYAHHVSPGTRLTAIVEQLYNMLGFRHGAFSRDLADCLSPPAVQWVNHTLAHAPGVLPTERSPLDPAPRKPTMSSTEIVPADQCSASVRPAASTPRTEVPWPALEQAVATLGGAVVPCNDRACRTLAFPGIVPVLVQPDRDMGRFCWRSSLAIRPDEVPARADTLLSAHQTMHLARFALEGTALSLLAESPVSDDREELSTTICLLLADLRSGRALVDRDGLAIACAGHRRR